MKKFFLLTILVLFAACEEDKYSQVEMLNMAKAGDPNIEYLIPKSLKEEISCPRDYPGIMGCLSGITARVRQVKIVVLEFKTADQAKRAAYHLDQYYVKNWAFDDVTGEPVLEDFVKKAFAAKRPKIDEPDYLPLVIK